MEPKRPSSSIVPLILMALVGLLLVALAALGAPGCGRVSASDEEIRTDLQKAADEAIVVKSKDWDFCLVYVRGQYAVRGAETLAVRYKSLEHLRGEEHGP